MSLSTAGSRGSAARRKAALSCRCHSMTSSLWLTATRPFESHTSTTAMAIIAGAAALTRAKRREHVVDAGDRRLEDLLELWESPAADGGRGS